MLLSIDFWNNWLPYQRLCLFFITLIHYVIMFTSFYPHHKYLHKKLTAVDCCVSVLARSMIGMLIKQLHVITT